MLRVTVVGYVSITAEERLVTIAESADFSHIRELTHGELRYPTADAMPVFLSCLVCQWGLLRKPRESSRMNALLHRAFRPALGAFYFLVCVWASSWRDEPPHESLVTKTRSIPRLGGT